VVAAAIAGGVAYATIPDPGNVYSACMLKGLGTIRLIDKSLPSTNLMSHCTDKETEVSWNQAGQAGPPGQHGLKGEPGAPGTNGTNGTNGADGKDGVSVTTASEPAGSNCADGGVQLTAPNGVGYVCNGKAGANGQDGVSVTSAVEPAGSNCANGGSRFTAANGTTYACNGAGGLSGYEIVQGQRSSIQAGANFAVFVDCPAGKKVLGGGYGGNHIEVDSSGPSGADTWAVNGWATVTGTSHEATAYAICASV
jgi:hypothetical protein